jgi:D-3-phosphoglycerate dehydrogenase
MVRYLGNETISPKPRVRSCWKHERAFLKRECGWEIPKYRAMKKTKRKFNVVITGPSIANEAVELLSRTARVECTKPYPKPRELAQKLREGRSDALIVRTGRITSEVIEATPTLKVITKHGTGVDNIDVVAATRLKVPVLITPFANYESVAEHTLAFMFSLAKDIPQLDSRTRKGCWDKATYRGLELCNKTLGLIGFGRIGRRVSELVAPLHMNVLVYDPFLGARRLPRTVKRVKRLESLLKAADIVSLHCPLTERTKHLIGHREFRMMKRTAWLINTARGEVVDETAAVAALREGGIAAAALDTFRKEPPEDIQVLVNAGKTVLTPHIAGTTEESFRRMGMDAVRSVLTVLRGKKPKRECIFNPEAYSLPK